MIICSYKVLNGSYNINFKPSSVSVSVVVSLSLSSSLSLVLSLDSDSINSVDTESSVSFAIDFADSSIATVTFSNRRGNG